ncbi:MAG: hypothetical protein IJX40_06525 [Alistipes sp.]|nr:hypothetical protein [Alistipes sp.]MBQ8367373.1 hypothetical protein [Alistipes sp.]
MKKNILTTLLILVCIFIFWWYIDHNFTFNFVSLYVVLIALMFLIYFVKEYKTTTLRKDGQIISDYKRINGVPCYNRTAMFWSYIAILIFGALSIYTFGNYVNPDKKIFYNYDHHAIKVEGIKVEKGFVVAGNDGQSFLDNSSINGSIRIVSFDDDNVTLQLEGVTSPIYVKEYTVSGDPYRDCCINQKCLFYHEGDDQAAYRATITGRYNDSDSKTPVVDFKVVQRHRAPQLWQLKRGQDSAIYYFGRGDDMVASSFTRFLKSGYELQSIALDAFTQMDLGGVNLIRPIIYHNLKQKSIKEKYPPQDYLIELERQNNIKSISVNGADAISVERMLQQVNEVSIPYDQAFYIGFGENKTESVKFTKLGVDENGDPNVAIMYELPHYQSLSSTNRGRETSLMVASSIINAQDNPDDSGLINTITENLALFNLFENHGNRMHIKPFFVSYVSDVSNVEMVFRLLTSGGECVQNGIKAGAHFPGITSQDGAYEWLISIENFKDTTPFKASYLVWILFGVVVCSVLSMYYSSVNRLYTAVECATHLLVIAYLTVKFFLLWRTTVFSPVSSISFYEFHHFRDISWLSIIVWSLLIFYLVLWFVKYNIIRHNNLSIFTQNRGVLEKFALSQPVLWCKVLMSVGLMLSALSSAAIALLSNGIIFWVALFVGVGGILGSLYISLPRSTTVKFATLSAVAIGVLIIVGNLWTAMIPMLLFCVLMLVCFVRYLVVIFPNNQLRWVVSIAIPVIAILYVVVEMILARPMFRVLGGALIYFAVDWFIYKMFSTSYVTNYIDSLEKKPSDKTAFSLSIWNMLCMSAATLVADGGYGIMFTLFMIFASWIKITDMSNYENHSYRRFRWLPKTLLYVILIVLICLIASYKNIFLSLYNAVADGGVFSYAFVFVVIALAIVASVMVALNIRFRWWHIIIPISAVVCLVVVTFTDVLDSFTSGHTEYRIRVHMENPGEVLSKVETNEEQNKFLQASLNDWILYEYQTIGDDIVSFGEEGTGYFKLQPQSKIGAMWFAQTTDICLSRYIIAEHGLLLAILFVVSFAVYLLIAMASVSVYRWSRIITLQVALLFAVQSLMIFLANTRAFIFFGQDFPLISITSRVSALYFFILVSLGVIYALLGKNQHNQLMQDDASLAITIKQRNKNGIIFIFILLLVSAGILYSTGRNNNYAEGLSYSEALKNRSSEELLAKTDLHDYAYYNKGVYDVEFLMARVSNDLDTYITPALKMYQRDIKRRVPLRRDMSSFVDSLFEYDSMKMALEKCDSITIRLLNHYKKSGSKHNSIRNIICLRNVRTIDYVKLKGMSKHNVVYRDTLEFATGVNAINYHMPSKRRSQWTGSIIEASKYGIKDSVHMYADGVVYIPKRITNGEEVQLVSAVLKNRRVVVGADGIIELKANGVSVVNARKNDYIINGQNKCLDSLPLHRYRYFAKNILINGDRAFLYPFGHKMLWSRDVVADVISMHKHLMSKNNRGLSNSDIMLNVNSDLTLALYDVYSTNLGSYNDNDGAADRAVIVADGDGNVRAMVDYRINNDFRVNPNDYRRIAKISDSLYINFEKGRATETRYFGNFSRNALRRGPGSTQKPIVWTAVTTMYNTGWWDNLKMKAPDSLYLNDDNKTTRGNYYTFSKYAGEPIESIFKSLKGDEKGVNGMIDVKNYIYKSSNYYNSIMAYIGAFSKKTLTASGFLTVANKMDNGTMFYKLNQDNRPGYRMAKPVQRRGQDEKDYAEALTMWYDNNVSAFPEMRIDKLGGNSTLTFNRFLSQGTILDTTALLPAGLSANFGLYLYKDLKARRPATYFNLAVRDGRTTPRQLNEYMVRSVAIGSNTIWSVSPFAMAEMYGRLITLNKNYKLSLYTVDKRKEALRERYTLFDVDESWNGVANYCDVRNELLKGMSLVYETVGTAGKLGIVKSYDIGGNKFRIKIDNGRVDKGPKDIPTFYVYGKTGTINGYWNGVDKDDHLLVTIITDKQLTQCSVDELEKVKYYVIFQVDYEYSGNGEWKGLDQRIINEVLQSVAFRDYMNINNK